jgi:hypothetical protein
MVLYSKASIENLSEILIGLINWPKHPLSVEHAEKYVTEISNWKKKIHQNTFCKRKVAKYLSRNVN